MSTATFCSALKNHHVKGARARSPERADRGHWFAVSSDLHRLRALLGAQENRAYRRCPRYRPFLVCCEADGWPVAAYPVCRPKTLTRLRVTAACYLTATVFRQVTGRRAEINLQARCCCLADVGAGTLIRNSFLRYLLEILRSARRFDFD